MQKLWSQSEIEFVKNNINKMGNVDIAKHLQRTRRSVSGFIERNKIVRNPKFLKILIGGPAKKQKGSLHPGWKGGISKDHYHYKKIQVKRYPKRIKAREKAYKALISGKIVKQKCEICGSANTQMHHEDYSKPYDVKFFCRKHHNRIH